MHLNQLASDGPDGGVKSYSFKYLRVRKTDDGMHVTDRQGEGSPGGWHVIRTLEKLNRLVYTK